VRCPLPLGPQLDVDLAQGRLQFRYLGEKSLLSLTRLPVLPFKAQGSGGDELSSPVPYGLFRHAGPPRGLRNGKLAGQDG
jgi:hypothetical protein